jgi:hypothetical protein
MDPAKYRLQKLASGQYQLSESARGESVALCQEPAQGGSSSVLTVFRSEGDESSSVDAGACVVRAPQPATVSAQNATKAITIGASTDTIVMTLRSTLEVIQYLGRILAFEEEYSRPAIDRVRETLARAGIGFTGLAIQGDGLVFQLTDPRLAGNALGALGNIDPALTTTIATNGAGAIRFNAGEPSSLAIRILGRGAPRCVTLGFESSTPGCNGDIMFNLQHQAASAPIGLDYNGQYWAVPQPQSCTATSCDHTLETMAIVSLLLNQNKSAKDIPSTPAVEVVP